MAITLAGLVDFAKRFNSDANTNWADEMFIDLVNDCVSQVFNASRWPFLEDEDGIALYAPYETGTVAVTNGSASVTGSSTVWLNSSWPTPAIMQIEGDANQYVVTSFGSSTTLTLDEPVLRATASGLTYTINFPCYDLPSDMLEMGPPTRTSWGQDLRPISYDDWIRMRQSTLWSGILTYYAVVPGDGTTGPKLYLYPAPGSAELIRFSYRKKFDRGVIYKAGTATATNASTSVTGSSTSWQKMGFSASGLILQFVDSSLGLLSAIQGTVSGAASSDTALTLSSAWSGPTYTAQSYRLSTKLVCPDLMLPCLRECIKQKVAEVSNDRTTAQYYDQKYLMELAMAKGALAPLGCVERLPVGGFGPEKKVLPNIPRLVARV